ncbi:prephenate dehydratase [Streptomyces nitrosporeus]|uniref:prephenate dehydratase n=1 Tax=Streptomyces nitrosporeus TaxID=28894 RepID=A0A5J6FBI9_9ACTN|nr:prephenate dehydratase [Streptomyces nitrosporeus]QEU73501.1 prephenate dehydratase [Streptomyces nitrosporeus]GGZ04132.1 prephenate dehydratase [Streptomyces nitrosporeus]
MTYAYLGPRGTFAEAALRLLPAATGSPWTPFTTVGTALDAVRDGTVSTAVVPLENSVRGVVPATLDELAGSGNTLHITAEIELPVGFSLMAKPGTRLDDIQRVLSHPHAHGQCRQWLAGRLPNARVLLSTSTASAAREVSESDLACDAAIAAPVAAERYGLEVLASGIGEREDAITRFVALRRAAPAPAPTGRDRSSFLLPADEVRGRPVTDLLASFSGRGVDVTWVQSWPAGTGLGSYHFFLDVNGHIDDEGVGLAIMALHRKGINVCFLGSYPHAGAPEPGPVVDAQAGALGSRSSEEWLEVLRAGDAFVA